MPVLVGIKGHTGDSKHLECEKLNKNTRVKIQWDLRKKKAQKPKLLEKRMKIFDVGKISPPTLRSE